MFKAQKGSVPAKNYGLVSTISRCGALTYCVTQVEDGAGERIYQAYIKGHKYLPENCEGIPLSEIMAKGEALLSDDLPEAEKKRLIIILGHHGSKEAWNYLRRYAKRATGELAAWAELARDECKMFMS